MLLANTLYSTYKYLAIIKLVIPPKKGKPNSAKFNRTKLKLKLKLALKKVTIESNSSSKEIVYYSSNLRT